MSNINKSVNQDPANLIESKWPDYLIQWRTSLWVSIREKESNVWKFVTFYAASISLIIGLGQKLVTTLDLTIDVSVSAAIVGLLTFWGLAIVIDSNSWMSRNLKLVGNIEKLFIPAGDYNKLIPSYYASPLFRYFRPYTVDFYFLIILGVIAYGNFLIHFPIAEQSWRQYLLPILTVIYVYGFHWIQGMDAYTREEYFRFFRNAPGEPIGSDIENMPVEHWEFKLATTALFRHWTFLAATAVVIIYGIRERQITQNQWIPWILLLVILVALFYWLISRWLSLKLREKETHHKNAAVNWSVLCLDTLAWGWKYKRLRDFYLKFAEVCRWLIMIATVVLICLANLQ